MHGSLPVWGTDSALYKTGCNQYLTRDLFFQVMELRAIECSTACTGMCVWTPVYFSGQPGSCSSSLESTRTQPFLADSAVTWKPFPVDVPPGSIRPAVCWGPLPAQPLAVFAPSPRHPSVCSPARLRAGLPGASSPASGCVLCPAKRPPKAGWWLKLERASSLLISAFHLAFFSQLLFPWFFSFSACARHYSASYWCTSFQWFLVPFCSMPVIL